MMTISLNRYAIAKDPCTTINSENGICKKRSEADSFCAGLNERMLIS
jgi:hypothetical protein